MEHTAGKTTGKVKKKLTSLREIKDHDVKTSRQHPEYLVIATKSHKEAAHNAESLKKIGVEE